MHMYKIMKHSENIMKFCVLIFGLSVLFCIFNFIAIQLLGFGTNVSSIGIAVIAACVMLMWDLTKRHFEKQYRNGSINGITMCVAFGVNIYKHSTTGPIKHLKTFSGTHNLYNVLLENEQNETRNKYAFLILEEYVGMEIVKILWFKWNGETYARVNHPIDYEDWVMLRTSGLQII